MYATPEMGSGERGGGSQIQMLQQPTLGPPNHGVMGCRFQWNYFSTYTVPAPFIHPRTLGTESQLSSFQASGHCGQGESEEWEEGGWVREVWNKMEISKPSCLPLDRFNFHSSWPETDLQ